MQQCVRLFFINRKESMKSAVEPTSNFRKMLEPLCRSRDTRQVFDAFVRLGACALSAQTREVEYLEEAKRWSRDELKIFGDSLGALVLEMETKPYEDVLGGYYMEFALSTKSQQWNGEFHTPKTVCDLIARMTMGDLEDMPVDRPITICEPACGAGAMILSLAQAFPVEARHRMRVTAIDINRTACDMCFINTTLWNIPTRVLHGNALSMEMWSAWSNLPLMLSPLCRRENDQPKHQGQPPAVVELKQIQTALNQQSAFSFA